MTSSKLLNNRLTRFIIVGISNTIISYVVFALLFYSQLFPDALRAPLSQALSYLAGMAWAFVWNRFWAFRQVDTNRARLWSDSAKFIVAQLSCLALSVVLVTFFIDYVRLLPELGWLLAMAIVTAANFLAMHFWVFPVTRSTDEPS